MGKKQRYLPRDFKSSSVQIVTNKTREPKTPRLCLGLKNLYVCESKQWEEKKSDQVNEKIEYWEKCESSPVPQGRWGEKKTWFLHVLLCK
jgi:hypothetical protein